MSAEDFIKRNYASTRISKDGKLKSTIIPKFSLDKIYEIMELYSNECIKNYIENENKKER